MRVLKLGLYLKNLLCWSIRVNLIRSGLFIFMFCLTILGYALPSIVDPVQEFSPIPRYRAFLNPDNHSRPLLGPRVSKRLVPIVKGSKRQPLIEDNVFFLEASGAPLWQICQSISEFYGVNVVVFDDVKNKEIFADLRGVDIEEVLNCITWLIGVEWNKRENIYYVGGNADNIQVFPSMGLDSKIEAVFGGNVKIVNDKLVVQGSERYLKKVSDAVEKLLDRECIKIQLKVIEIAYNDTFELGFEWDKAFEYSASWENMLKNVSPIQHIAGAVLVSSHLEELYATSRTLVNTELTILSGSQVDLTVGEDQDRQIYQTSDQGTRVVSGFSTQRTGLIVGIKAFEGRNFWVLDSSVENSKPVGTSELKKTLNKITTQVKAKVNGVYLLGSIRRESEDLEISKGVPFLNRVPLLGFLFGVHNIIQLRRDVYICIKVLPLDTPSPEPTVPASSMIESAKQMMKLINR